MLVTYDSSDLAKEPEIVRAINEALDEIGEATHVKIEANIWPANEAEAARRERMYDLLFSRHLARSITDAEWTIGDPDEAILAIAEDSYGNEEALRRVILNYTTYKHAGFTKAPRVFSQTDKALSALQRAFEFPKSTGRKVNQYLGIDRELTPEENWQALVESGLRDETRQALTLLHNLDGQYTRYLTKLVRGEVSDLDAERYRQWLTDVYPQAIDLGIIAASGFTAHIANLS